MRGLYTAVLSLGVLVLLADPASAQRQRRGGFGGPASLLQNESVQKELGLSPDQVEKVKKVGEEVREKFQGELQQLRDLQPEERREKGRELRRKASEDTYKAVQDVLKPEQVKRLKQIDLQQRGPEAFSDPEVQKTLKLTDEQKGKLKEVQDNASQQRREIAQSTQGNREEARTKNEALRKETTDKAMAVLTDQQKQAWKGLVGEPFKLERRRQGGDGG